MVAQLETRQIGSVSPPAKQLTIVEPVPSEHPSQKRHPVPPPSPQTHPLLSPSLPKNHPFLSSSAPASTTPSAWKGHRSHRRHHSTPCKPTLTSTCRSYGEDDFDDLMISLVNRKKKFGECHPQVGLAHNLIGNYHFRQGDLNAAAESYDAALCCFKTVEPGDGSQIFGDEIAMRHQLDVAVALGNIGAVFWRTGKLDEAIESLEKGLELRENVYAVCGKKTRDSVEVANALYSLGLARSLRGDYQLAMEALGCARNTLSNVYGPSHIEVARIEDAQGKCLLLQGDTDRALEHYVSALKTKAATLGMHHSSSLSTKMNIAAAYRMKGKLDKAISTYREVLSAQKLTLYRERDQDTRSLVTADIGVTMRMIGEIQRERSKIEGMAAIMEK